MEQLRYEENGRGRSYVAMWRRKTMDHHRETLAGFDLLLRKLWFSWIERTGKRWQVTASWEGWHMVEAGASGDALTLPGRPPSGWLWSQLAWSTPSSEKCVPKLPPRREGIMLLEFLHDGMKQISGNLQKKWDVAQCLVEPRSWQHGQGLLEPFPCLHQPVASRTKLKHRGIN